MTHHDLCGCCDIREKLKAMWERLQTTIYGIRVNGVRQIPDGQGIIDIEIGDVTVPVATDHSIGGVKSSTNSGKVSVSDTGIMTANGLAENIALTEDNTERLDDIDGTGGSIEQIEAEIGALQTADEQLGERMTYAEGRLDTAESDIDEHDQDIVVLEGQIDAINTAVSGMQVSKQDALVSGQNIKTINGEPVMGAGNIIVTKNTQYITVRYNTDLHVLTLLDTLTDATDGNAFPADTITVTPTLNTSPTYTVYGMIISRTAATVTHVDGDQYTTKRLTKPSNFNPTFDVSLNTICTRMISNLDELPDIDMSVDIRFIPYDTTRHSFMNYGTSWTGGEIKGTVSITIRDHVVTSATLGSTGVSSIIAANDDKVFRCVAVPVKTTITVPTYTEVYEA